ncbi:MAG: hypothetical protein QMC78_06105 [Methanocellales archaeon]|nr:hypothetical protein [Methanocellales archaeon]
MFPVASSKKRTKYQKLEQFDSSLLEGGFYGIISDDGEHYDPLNLGPEFQEDGLRVWFKAKISENQTSVHMWGTIVEIISIEKYDLSI